MASDVRGRLRSAYSALNWRPWLGWVIHSPKACSSSPGQTAGRVPTTVVTPPSSVSSRSTA